MIINDLDDYYIVFDTKNRNIELDTLSNKQHPTSNIQQATKSVWKTVPSVARVTRDEVSGLQTGKKRLSGRQYQTHSFHPAIS